MIAQQPGDVLYFILSGTVKIHVEQEDGSDVFIDILVGGDVIGEMSIVDNATRSATATPIEPTTVLWIDRAPLEEAMNTYPVLARNIARIISSRLRRATDRFQVMATRDSYGRVAHQLSFLVSRYGKKRDDGFLIPIPLTQGDLADLVGLTRERVNRVIGRFKKEKLLSVDSTNHITVHDLPTLTIYANR
jgi:CRP-like cAMP-binding protein